MPAPWAGLPRAGSRVTASELATFVITEQPCTARLLEHQGGMGFLPVPWELGLLPAHTSQGGGAPSALQPGCRKQDSGRVACVAASLEMPLWR